MAVLAVVGNRLKSPSRSFLAELEKIEHRADFIIGETIQEFVSHPKFEKIDAIVWVSPASTNILSDLWQTAQNSTIRWVHCAFAGLNVINPFIHKHLAPREDVVVTNGRGTSSRALAEYILCAALHFEKQIPRIMRNSQTGHWDRFPMGELHGKTMGFVGYGDIARTAARIAKHGFGMRVVAMRRRRGPDEEGLADAVYSSEVPGECLKVYEESDYLVVTLPGTAETAGLVGAALDVFEMEPLPAGSPLWGRGDVLVTAHNAFLTPAAAAAARGVLEANLGRFEAWVAAGAPPPGPEMATPVNKLLGY